LQGPLHVSKKRFTVHAGFCRESQMMFPPDRLATVCAAQL